MICASCGHETKTSPPYILPNGWKARRGGYNTCPSCSSLEDFEVIQRAGQRSMANISNGRLLDREARESDWEERRKAQKIQKELAEKMQELGISMADVPPDVSPSLHISEKWAEYMRGNGALNNPPPVEPLVEEYTPSERDMAKQRGADLDLGSLDNRRTCQGCGKPGALCRRCAKFLVQKRIEAIEQQTAGSLAELHKLQDYVIPAVWEAIKPINGINKELKFLKEIVRAM